MYFEKDPTESYNFPHLPPLTTTLDYHKLRIKYIAYDQLKDFLYDRNKVKYGIL